MPFRTARSPWLLMPIALALALSTARAQETTGRIEGRVVDSKGQPIAYVQVIARSPSLQGARGTQTDETGRFALQAIPVGEYSIRIAQLGLQPVTLERIQVQLGQATTLGVVHMTETVIPQDEVVVSGRRALVDPTTTVLGGSLSARDYDVLPVERDYKTLAILLPHANTSTLGDPVNVAGATGLENRYFLDGTDVTDPFRSATGTRLPYNFVEELQLKVGGYSAEYRSALGGTMNAVTYSGGNQVSGQIFGFFTSNGLSATPRSIPGTPAGGAYSLYDFGFGIGGPIRKDRLWYYAGYNPSVSREDVNLPGLGNYTDHNTTHSLAGKLTWRADERNTVVLTAVGDPVRGRQVTGATIPPASADPFLFDIRQGGVTAILEGRHVVSDHLLLLSTISHESRTEDSNPATTIGQSQPQFTDSTGAVSGGGPRNNNQSDVTTLSLHASWINRGEEVKAGVEYRTNRLEFDNGSDLIVQTDATTYYRQISSFQGHVGSRNPSAFLQHSWQPTPRLTVDDGLRWDGEYWISSQDRVAQTILDEWQPRFGVTYQPGRLGTQKVYASAGRFYQDITTSPLFWYYNLGSSFFAANYDHDPRSNPAGADTVGYLPGHIQPPLAGLQGQYSDEVTVGYERQLGTQSRLAVRGIERALRKGIEDGVDLASGYAGLANPGIGALQAFPPMTRRYAALELSVQGLERHGMRYLASYVLSRNSGDHEGLFDSRLNNPYPNATGLYDFIYQTTNATGPLPNDHTHVLKLAGSYRTHPGMTLGTLVIISSGSPVSEFGGTPLGTPYYAFVGDRGSHGRTPATWDLNLRLGYEPPLVSGQRFHTRLTADFMHVASQRKPVRYDEVHYRALDSAGNETDPNPNYRKPIAFQPPMEVRLGAQTSF